MKADKICEIVYGLVMQKADKRGMLIEPEKPTCNGGCVIQRCHPTKKCLRCYKDF